MEAKNSSAGGRQGVFGRLAALAAALGFAGAAWGAQPPQGPQASLTLTNCGSALCNFTDTAWSLDKTPDTQTKTGPGPQNIAWTVNTTKGATSANMISVNGSVTIVNTGTADATIGNIVVNLQKPRTGPNTGACRNIPWVSAAANVATASAGDGALAANIVAAGSQEVQACNAAQGPANYVVSGAKGTFTETAGSGSLQFTDANSNTVWSISPERVLVPGESVTLLYTATFDASALGLSAGTPVRAEAIVTFGNVNSRGGSGAAAQNIDIDGNGGLEADEANVRSVPCRVTTSVPALFAGNATVTLTDQESDVSVVGTNVSLANFLGFGSASTSTSATTSLSVDETCTPDGGALVFNTAHLTGTGSSVTVQGPQIGVSCDPLFPTICTPIYAQFEFACVAPVALNDTASADVACSGVLPPFGNGDFCTYTQGGYGGPGGPYQLLAGNFASIFPTGVEAGIPGAGGFSMKFTSSTAVQNYLPAGGPANALTLDVVDPTSTSSRVFGGQVLTLKINVAESGAILGTPAGFGGLYYCKAGDSLSGQTVSGVLAAMEVALGGGALPAGHNFSSLNAIADGLNSGSFHECNVGAFVANLSRTPCQ